MPNIKRSIHEVNIQSIDLTSKPTTTTTTTTTTSNDNSIKDQKIKKAKTLNVRFDSVNVFYFQRQQGFTCIPSSGNNTIGI